jgi:5'-nucleotidase
VKASSEVQALIAPALARVEEVQRRGLGIQVPSRLGRSYEAESPLGNLLADSLRQAAQADVALLNSGGLRADLPAGELTYGHVYEVLPFDNTIAVITLSGEQLRRLLQVAYGAHKGVFQLSGLTVKLRPCPGPDRLLDVRMADGRPLPAGRPFRVAVPDFLARGGDGLDTVLRTLPEGSVDLGERREHNFRDALIAHWQEQGRPLSASVAGRIQMAPAPKGCTPGGLSEGH